MNMTYEEIKNADKVAGVLKHIFLQPKIGVFYKDEDWAKYVLDGLEYRIDGTSIRKISLRDSHSFVELKTGLCVHFVDILSTEHSLKFDNVLIQDGISDEVIDTIIKPSLNVVASPRIAKLDKSGELDLDWLLLQNILQ